MTGLILFFVSSESSPDFAGEEDGRYKDLSLDLEIAERW
jgi:hypothetical protein